MRVADRRAHRPAFGVGDRLAPVVGDDQVRRLASGRRRGGAERDIDVRQPDRRCVVGAVVGQRGRVNPVPQQRRRARPTHAGGGACRVIRPVIEDAHVRIRATVSRPVTCGQSTGKLCASLSATLVAQRREEVVFVWGGHPGEDVVGRGLPAHRVGAVELGQRRRRPRLPRVARRYHRTPIAVRDSGCERFRSHNTALRRRGCVDPVATRPSAPTHQQNASKLLVVGALPRWLVWRPRVGWAG